MADRLRLPYLSKENWRDLARARLRCDQIAEAISGTRVQQAPLMIGLLAEIATITGGLADACARAELEYQKRRIQHGKFTKTGPSVTVDLPPLPLPTGEEE